MKEEKGPIIKKTVPNEIILEEVRQLLNENPERNVSIVVVGFSMRPFLEHQRDRVVLSYPKEIKKGDAVLALVAPNRYVLHRIIKKEGNMLTLMGDGNVRGTESCKVEDVIATTTAFIRKGNTYASNSWQWRYYSWIWLHLTWVRRWLLAIYRRLI